MRIFHYTMIVGIFLLILFFFALQIRKNYGKAEQQPLDIFDLNYLIQGIKESFQSILKMRLEELNLNRFETEKRIRNKSKLRKSIRLCSCGDMGAKAYVKDYIVELLQKKFQIEENTINRTIPFDQPSRLTTQDKFEILLYLYKKKFGYHGLEKLIEENRLDEGTKGEGHFEITSKDIHAVYQRVHPNLEYIDKLDILAQRIYENYLGHGVIDEIRDMKIDGVSGGVSGLPIDLYSYSEELMRGGNQNIIFSFNSVWLFFHGKLIYLSCLGFGSQRELERICKNIYRYNNPGQLSEEKGHIENDMKDGSRVVVVRPPFSDSWAFLVRKHDSFLENVGMEDLITDPGKEVVIGVLLCLVKGCQVTAITGEQGSGKTTLLRVLIQYINPTYSLRIQELIFELWLRRLYPERNILTFKELPNVSGQEGLDLQKKTDGAVNILGEVATSSVANWVIQMAQVASLFTMFTHHAKRTEDLISWMRNALLKDGGFNNERVAEDQVVRVINFDIHMTKRTDGHRYIERVTEILPVKEKDTLYETRNIIIFSEGKYEFVHPISTRSREQIFRYLSEEEKIQYGKYFEGVN